MTSKQVCAEELVPKQAHSAKSGCDGVLEVPREVEASAAAPYVELFPARRTDFPLLMGVRSVREEPDSSMGTHRSQEWSR